MSGRRDPCGADWHGASVCDIIHQALASTDEDQYWHIVGRLHRMGSREVFDAAAYLCQSEKPEERVLCAHIISQLGAPDMPFAGERTDILTAILRMDRHPDVLAAAAIAIGHMHVCNTEITELLVPMADATDAHIRRAVSFGLSGCTHEEAIDALIRLSADQSRDVRDWATHFGLDSLRGPDTLEIRDALVKRTQDEDAEVRSAALLGLAHRKDPRVLGPLKEEIERQSDQPEVFDYIFEAAWEMADPSLCPALLAFRTRRGSRYPYLEDAITACAEPHG